MIAKLSKGRGFRGALAYDLQPGKGQLLETNMAGRTPRALAAEFGAVRALRPTLERAVCHAAISAAPGEHLTDDQWRTIGRQYLEGMGFANAQYVLTRHTDTAHEHIHILANRIRLDGSVVSDSHDYRRQEGLMRGLEHDLGLTPVRSSHEISLTERHAQPTRDEMEMMLRTGEASIKQRLATTIDLASADHPAFSVFAGRLEAAGVELVPNVASTGRVSGLSYRLEGELMKGSDLGKAYSWKGIQQRGVAYEQARDDPALEHARERAAVRDVGDTDRGLAAGPAPERGGLGDPARTLGASAGRADGRDADGLTRDAGRDPHDRDRDAGGLARPAGNGAAERQRDLDGPPWAGPHGPGRGDAGDAARDRDPGGDGAAAPDRGEGDPRRTGGVDLAGVGDGGRDWAGRGGSWDRLVDLAAPAFERDRTTLAGAGAAGRAALAGAEREGPDDGQPALGLDRTREAVRHQLDAMACDQYEVGIREAKTGRMLTRTWTAAEVDTAVSWLKRMNARGHDIFLRPEGSPGLVLVDDLQASRLGQMRRDGYGPAVVLETRPGRFQAWVRVADVPLAPVIATMAMRALARDYTGDLPRADGYPYGRLAGFTNQQPAYAHDGQQPFVRVREHTAQTAPHGPDLVHQLEEHHAQRLIDQERQARLDAIAQTAPVSRWDRERTVDLVQEYRQQAHLLQERYPHTDSSRLDWMIVKDLAMRGHEGEAIKEALWEASPQLADRKAGHVEDYVNRTVDKVLGLPEVQRARSVTREHDRDLGMGF